MVSNYFSLRAVARLLHSTTIGSLITQAYCQDQGVLAIELEGSNGTIVVSLQGTIGTFYQHDRMARARRNSADVLKNMHGLILLAITIHPGDRVVTIALQGGKRLILQFFGAASNAFLLDPHNVIVDAFRSARTYRGTTYLESAALPLSFTGDLTGESTPPLTPVASLLRQRFPVLGPVLIREVLFRARVPEGLPVTVIPDESRKNILNALHNLLKELEEPRPRIYTCPEQGEMTMSLSPLLHLAHLTFQEFPSIHQAIHTCLIRRRGNAGFRETHSALVRRLRGSLERAQRTIAAIEREALGTDREELYSSAGMFLMEHLSGFPAGQDHFTVPTGAGETTFRLDPALSVARNAQRYFEKARHARRSREVANQRRESLLRHQGHLRELLDGATKTGTREELDSFMKTHRNEIERHEGPNRADAVPFRVFHVEGGFEVWAGKNNENNDLLTLRHARPNDLWFHARGCPGSHVVLRVNTGKGEPGKRAREQSAGIAAYYSKMRTARVVPVTMTERKYVHKPKGAPAGTVALKREQVVMVSPGLPAQPEHDTPDEEFS